LRLNSSDLKVAENHYHFIYAADHLYCFILLCDQYQGGHTVTRLGYGVCLAQIRNISIRKSLFGSHIHVSQHPTYICLDQIHLEFIKRWGKFLGDREKVLTLFDKGEITCVAKCPISGIDVVGIHTISDHSPKWAKLSGSVSHIIPWLLRLLHDHPEI